jgi:hypothetical protein
MIILLTAEWVEGIPPDQKTVLRSRSGLSLPEVNGLDSCPMALAAVAAIKTFQETKRPRINKKENPEEEAAESAPSSHQPCSARAPRSPPGQDGGWPQPRQHGGAGTRRREAEGWRQREAGGEGSRTRRSEVGPWPWRAGLRSLDPLCSALLCSAAEPNQATLLFCLCSVPQLLQNRVVCGCAPTTGLGKQSIYACI